MKTRWAVAIVSLAIAGGARRAAADLPFVEDDYRRALALGAKEHLPLFVEVSAPW
jgi:hypothetical protein